MKNNKVIKFFAVLAFTTLACQFLSPSETSLSGPDKYFYLRNEALNTKPEDIEIEVSGDTPYGIVLDISFEDGYTETLISFSNGYSNLLYPTGDEGTNKVDYAPLKNEAILLVNTSKRFIESMEITKEFPLPTQENMIIYVLTPNGIYTSGEINQENDFSNGKVSFYNLYFPAFPLLSAYHEF